MTAKLKITTVGNSAGIVLPREILAKLRVDKGDTVYLTETPSGFQISPYQPDLEKKMEAMEIIMRENRDVLKMLSES